MKVIKLRNKFVKQVTFSDRITVIKDNGYYEVRELSKSKNGKVADQPKIKTYPHSIGAIKYLVDIGFTLQESHTKISELG
tara:strand:- start:461 stop:700 length:240 start_codon:yes stop_codon:yes gene_type:complete